MARLMHGYGALPTDVKGWREIVEPAKDAYWLSRRNGKDETSALLNALDVAIAAATAHQVTGDDVSAATERNDG